MIEWKYEITHSEGKYLSEDIRYYDPMWKSSSFDGIQSLMFHIPGGKKIVLSGMEQYNFFIEVLQSIGGDVTKKAAVYLLGKYDNQVYGYACGGGNATKIESQFGQEYFGTVSNGWKQGLKQSKFVCELI